jgi:dihydrofolate reductase
MILMGKLVVSENVTLDGVVQDPAGEEGFAHGGWFDRLSPTDRAGFAKVFQAEAEGADALLCGRRSYEWFAVRWVERTGPWADRLREMPKYVVTGKLDDRGWGPATAIGLDDVASLKDRVAGEITVNGSRQLVQALLERDLVDEIRLLVYPEVLGSGDRLFGPATTRALRLAGSETVGDGLLLLTYRTV